MSTNLNNLNCALRYGNTGTNACDIEPDLNVQDLGIPKGYTFPLAATASPAAFIAAVQAGLKADDPAQRFYWLGRFQTYTPQGEDAVRQTSGYGNSRQVRQATWAEQLAIWDGKGKYAEQWKTFHGKQGQFDLIRFDRANVAWGKKVTVANGDVLLGGYSLSDLSFGNYTEPDGTNGVQWMVNISYTNAYELNVNFAAIQLDADPFAASTGLISVDISATSSGATNLGVTARTSYGRDLGELYSAELAKPAAWVVKNAATGAVITVTSVTAAGNGWTFLLVSGGANPGTGGTVTVQLAAPSALAALTPPVIGIASDVQPVTLG